MPDQNKNGDPRFEKLTKSVLESDHPIFAKIRKEMPNFQQRQSLGNPFVAKWQDWQKRFQFSEKLFIIFFSIVISFFIYRQISDPFLDYKLGDIAKRHLIAQRSMEMVDEETTDAKKKAALDGILSVYDFDPKIFFQLKRKIEKSFMVLRKQHQALLAMSTKKSAADLEKTDAYIEAKKSFAALLEVDLTDSQFTSIIHLGYAQRLERILVHVLAKVNSNFIVSNRELIKAEVGRGISMNFIGDDPTASRERSFNNLGAIIDVEGAREAIENDQDLGKFFSGPFAAHREKMISLAKKLVVPNLTLSRQETERRKSAAIKENSAVMMRINKGETIVKPGDTINKHHLAILRQMEKLSQNDNSKFQFIFTAIFLSIIIYSISSFLHGGITAFTYHRKDLLAIGLMMIASVLLIKGIQFVAAEAFIKNFPEVPFDFYYYLVPVTAGTVIIRMLMEKEPALIYAVVLSVVGGILLERNFFYAAYLLSSSLLAATFATHIKTRAVIYRAGMFTGFFNIVMITCIIANSRNAGSLSMLWEDVNWILWAGFISGIMMSVIVVALVPGIELISGRTSDLRLLELANMNHPLLRDLMVKAPGTYHHCIVIGSLVESAAEAIGANPLMARVMAYYHDVGKMERPQYFIENQAGGYNRHDSLQPHMSAMIIREHVKKGQELGRKFSLPQPLIDAMSEHHGSSTIWYFYNKARSQADDPDSVLESDYKYDGQKPQSKETALVMLGDVVEAATRSVADPTPLRLSGVVKNILNKYFAEGQLSECDLTLRDLDLIAKSFLDVLLGIYHSRIEYGVPSLKDSGKRKHGSNDSKGNQRPSAGGGIAQASGAAPYNKPYQVPSAGSGGSKKS